MIVTGTTCNPWVKCCASNQTGSSFSATVLETLSPATNGQPPALVGSNGWVTISQSGQEVEHYVAVRPMADGNNNTASLRIWGLNEINLPTGGQKVYVPTLLASISYTAGNLASQAISGLFTADTITWVAGVSNYELSSPTGDLPSLFAVDMIGSQWLFFDFAINSGSAAAMNGLYKTFS